eukprot:gnl/MRDRNA2_/MRDRNA2_31575_c0_seq1.p1 gnl/MRDRNA2_/MRDRNA2_31575_c0~~gnl/MRDRNA2_/MRDRNA2_31575_c0_seq1.p1  ORF type:complete len:120 (+),score=21.21 gnl/MRDRNA2_/MRDRNA2_31575_c0_seq1:24-383(+)
MDRLISCMSSIDRVAILRSDGQWKYARLLEMIVVLDFEVDEEGRVKELEFPGGLLPSSIDQVKALKPLKAELSPEPSLLVEIGLQSGSIALLGLIGFLVGIAGAASHLRGRSFPTTSIF